MLKQIITPQKYPIKNIIQRKHGDQLITCLANKTKIQK